MKNKISVLLIALFVILLCACSDATKNQKIDESQIKNICELATVECYFNNLAITTIPKGEGFSHLFEKDREFWLEYEGIVKLGIDMNDVSIKVSNNKITVTMPHAKVLSSDFNYDSLKKPQIVTNDDSWINKNKITSEEQQKAIITSQNSMIETINDNETLISRAENRAKILIENYINEIGKMSGTEYEIIWKIKEQ